MKKIFFALIFISQLAYSQFKFNGDFENINPITKEPEGWGVSFNVGQEKAYLVKIDSLVKKSGKYSLSIENADKEAEFGGIDISFKQNFVGREIELRGYIKSDKIITGYAGFWLRLDGQNGSPEGFDNMQNRGVKGTTDWREYSIKLPYKGDDVRSIHAGGLLVGDGKVWFDKMELLIDGKPVEKVKIKQIVLAKAEADTAFSTNSGIKEFSLNPQLYNNLVLAGQFWGFLKYHHPAIAKGDYNWDAELFRLLPLVISAKNNHELSLSLENFLNKLPVPVACKNCNQLANKKYEIMPDYGSLLNGSVLNKSLSDKLIYIKNNRNVDKNYYVEMNSGIGNPKFINEKPYNKMAYPDAGYRLLSLYRYWAMINYFFPYKNIIGEDWNAVLSSALPSFVNAKNDLEYSIATMKLIARVHDTHANLWSGSSALNGYKGKYAAPFQAKFIEGKLTITALHTDTLDVISKLAIGDIILSINGKDISTLIKEYLPITAASNYDTQLRDLPSSYLLRSNDFRMTMQILHDGKSFDYNVPMGKLSLAYKDPAFDTAVAFKILDNNIGYVFPGKYKNADLPQIKELFAKTRGIIIDMRCYPLEFMPFTFGNYIKDAKSDFVKFMNGLVSYPGAFAYSAPLLNGETGKDSYKGKVIVIVNSTTQSQAEYTTVAFQSSANVKVVGSITAGADGNVSMISLPGGLKTMISGLGVFYPNGDPTQRVGVKIDYKIYPTIKGVKAGKDELMDKAVELLNSAW